MTQPGPKQTGVSDHRACTHAVPASEGDLGAGGAGRDRERWTSNEPEPARPLIGGSRWSSGCWRR